VEEGKETGGWEASVWWRGDEAEASSFSSSPCGHGLVTSKDSPTPHHAASHICLRTAGVEDAGLACRLPLLPCLSDASSSLIALPFFPSPTPIPPFLSPTQSIMTTNISKKRKFIADGVFYAELNEVRAGRGLRRGAEGGEGLIEREANNTLQYKTGTSGLAVRVLPLRC